MKSLFFFSLILLFSSCTNEDEVILKPQISKGLTFNIGYKTTGINKGNSGSFKKDDQLYFYFFHHIFTNQISIFNSQQEKVDSILVKKYNSKSNPILSVNFINSDTILLRTKHNISYFINREANLLKTINTDVNFTNIVDSTYEVYPRCYNILDKQFLFVTNYNDKNNPYRTADYCDYIKYFATKSFSSKRLLFVKDIFADSLVTEHYLDNFELNYTDTNHFSMVLPHFFIRYPNLFIYTAFSDYIFLYSLNTHQIIRKIKISSEYSNPLHISTFEFNNNCEEKLTKQSYMKVNSAIRGFFFSNFTNRYYVLARKTATLNDQDLRYSIIAYGANFNKIGETPVFETSMNGLFWTEKGVYISLSENNKEYETKKIKYKYYEFTD